MYMHLSASALAAKVKCVLEYFRRLAEDKNPLTGAITFKRQVDYPPHHTHTHTVPAHLRCECVCV